MMEWTVFIPMCMMMMNDGSCLVYFFFLIPVIDFLFPIPRQDQMSMWVKYLWPVCLMMSLSSVEKHWLSILSGSVVYAQAIGFSTNVIPDQRKISALVSYGHLLFPVLIMMPVVVWNGDVGWHLSAWMLGISLYSTSECLNLDHLEFPIENATEDSHGFALGDMVLFHNNDNIIYMPHSRPWMMMKYWFYT